MLPPSVHIAFSLKASTAECFSLHGVCSSATSSLRRAPVHLSHSHPPIRWRPQTELTFGSRISQFRFIVGSQFKLCSNLLSCFSSPFTLGQTADSLSPPRNRQFFDNYSNISALERVDRNSRGWFDSEGEWRVFERALFFQGPNLPIWQHSVVRDLRQYGSKWEESPGKKRGTGEELGTRGAVWKKRLLPMCSE